MEAEKPSTIQTYNLLSAIPKTLRILELCLAVLLLSWTLTRLPFAVTVSAAFLRSLAASPLFIFAVSNAIIAALLAQSGRFSADTDSDQETTNLYREFLTSRSTAADPPPPPPLQPECQDKEVIIISETVQDKSSDANAGAGAGSDVVSYRRSQSEKWKGEARRKELRRSETEKLREKGDDEMLYPQDELSNEEFQRAIDAFIAKQMRFLREESSAIVVQNPF